MRKTPRTKKKKLKKKNSDKPRFFMVTAITTGLLGAFVLLFLLSFFRQVTVSSAPEMRKDIVRVQILNGCGIKGLAERTGDIIRNIENQSIRFDVVEVKNAPVFGFDRTLVVSRKTDDRGAQLMAEQLELPNPVLTERLARNPLEIDVTLVVGSDFEELEI